MALRDYVMSVKIAAFVAAVGVALLIGLAFALWLLGAMRERLPAELLDQAGALRASLIAGSSLCLILLAALAWWIIANVSKPLHAAASFAQQVAGGDLTGTLKSTRTDEMGWLYYELGNMAKRLRETALAVHRGAHAVSASADGIRSLTDQRTDAQAATLEQSVAAIRHLSDAVKQNAQQAAQAGLAASDAGSAGAKSRDVVERIVGSMAGISGSSKKIEDIVGVIDGITFQTNILALNAAVEAARAGEQGRGFGVVAAEVRMLAQRSAQASKEIKALIQQSSEQIDAGGQLVREAVGALRESIDGIQSVQGLARSIKEVSGEQISAVEQLNRALAQIEQVSNQNLMLAQDTEAGVKSVQEQAHDLVALVARFKVDTASAAAPTRPPAAIVTAASQQRVSAALTARPAAVGQVRKLAASKLATPRDEWAEF